MTKRKKAENRQLDGVKIKVLDDRHCSTDCPLFDAPFTTCALLRGTKYCLAVDGDILSPDCTILRCRKCRRLERK